MASFASFLTDTQAAVYARATQAPARTLLSTFQQAIISVSGVITQRIEGGSPMYKINAAAKVPFKAVDSSGNGLTGLTITAKTGKDGANPTTTSNAAVESGQGWYYITLTSTEMNGEIVVLDVSASGATIAPIVIHTEADYTAARAAHLDADISTRASSTNITAGTITTVTTLTNAPSDSSGTTTLLGRLTSTRAGLLDHLDADISSRGTSTYAGGAVASVTAAVTVGTNNDKTGYALSSAGVQAVWDALTSALTTAGSIGKRIVDYLTGDIFARIGAPAGASISADIAAISSAPSASTVASAVRTELTTELGRIDAAISTRSTYAGADTSGTTTLLSRITGAALLAASYTAPDNAGIAAVKAKTDNLPSDPADASDISGAFLTVNSTLATIAGYVDTEVAAIKAKTDLIPASPAAVGDIPTASTIASTVWEEDLSGHATTGSAGAALTAAASGSGGGGLDAGGVRAALGLASANLDTQLAALPTATENADETLKRDWTAITGEADRSLLNAARAIRNGFTISGTVMAVLKEDDTSAAYTRDLTTDAAAVPITGVS